MSHNDVHIDDDAFNEDDEELEEFDHAIGEYEGDSVDNKLGKWWCNHDCRALLLNLRLSKYFSGWIRLVPCILGTVSDVIFNYITMSLREPIPLWRSQ